MGVDSCPILISDNENIVRCICSPYHVSSNGKLKHNAFDPTPGTDEVSVIRSDFKGADFCKMKAKELEDLRNTNNPKTYRGLAVLSAKQIRIEGADVVDSRNEYHGHADIKHGFKTAPYEPPSPATVYTMRERNKKLAKIANYHLDPEPSSPQWKGSALSFQNLT